MRLLCHVTTLGVWGEACGVPRADTPLLARNTTSAEISQAPPDRLASQLQPEAEKWKPSFHIESLSRKLRMPVQHLLQANVCLNIS